jgi:tetratricopeptide (TPR) repeat protein
LRFDFGKVLYDCREWEQALSQFQHAIHHRKRRIRSLIYRSNILEKLERHAEAKQELETALNELPEMTREKREVTKQLERLRL